MEISCYPRTYAIQKGSSPGPDGKQVPTVNLVFLDVGGMVVKVTLGLQDWEAFQKAVADPEGAAREAQAAAAAAEARSRLVIASSPLGQQKGQKHKQ